MSEVSVFNEWDPLEEIIVGSMDGARVPVADKGLHLISFHAYPNLNSIPSGPYADWVIKETEDELNELVAVLEGIGVTVRRPDPAYDHSFEYATPLWSSDGHYSYCPRDSMLAIGNTIIETPMVLRSRAFEARAYRHLLARYSQSGARWIAAPRPDLSDDMYLDNRPVGQRLANIEPAFDAANVLRFNKDILYLSSDSGNQLGAQWLANILGDEYNVVSCQDLYASTHIDSTIVPLDCETVLLNPERVTDENLPKMFDSWRKIYSPDLVETPYYGTYPACSKWIGMNLLVVRPGLVVADRRQQDLIRLLESHGYDVIQLQLTHSRTLGGGFHCATLDVRRRAAGPVTP
jgi:glycine amidinotransferase/scyllo-inosamine-4-phosphate amidinotransferase 1